MLIPKIDERRRTSAWPCSLCQASCRHKPQIRSHGSWWVTDRKARRSVTTSTGRRRSAHSGAANENEAEIDRQNEGRGGRNDGGQRRDRDARRAWPRYDLCPARPAERSTVRRAVPLL